MARKFFPIVVLALVFAIFYTPDNFEPESIRGRRVLITGSSTGIGEQLAYAYSKLGAAVMLTARSADLLKKVAAKCKELGAQSVHYVPADMARSEDRERVVVETEKRLGGGGLDQLILNHAFSEPGPFAGNLQNLTAMQKELDVNFVSFVHLATRSVKMLSKSKDGIGRIAVVSSAAGKLPTPLFASYSAAKFALQGFFGAWRQELRSRNTPVSVTLCVLGYIRTARADKVLTEHYSRMIAALPMDPPSAEDAAEVIMKATTRGAYEFSYPKFVGLATFVHSLLPGYSEDFAASNLL